MRTAGSILQGAAVPEADLSDLFRTFRALQHEFRIPAPPSST